MQKDALLDILRDRSLSLEKFRKTTHELSLNLAKENKERLFEKPILIVILRAGMALLPAFLERFPDSPVGFLGIARDEKTAKAGLYYEKLPPISSKDTLLILDPMIATAGSICLAITILCKHKATVENMHIVSLLCAPEGLNQLSEKYASAHFTTVSIDEGLDDKKFIVPGLGDFGDRFFGNVSSSTV